MRIRAASRADVALLVGFVRATVDAMAGHGGHRLGDDDAPWQAMAADVAARLDDPDHCFLIAEADVPLGGAIARVAGVDEIFVPIRSLHVSVVYVEPAARRRGLGRRLLEEALDWGRRAGCTRADLHVLDGNPARRLYESLGFAPFQLEMARML